MRCLVRRPSDAQCCAEPMPIRLALWLVHAAVLPWAAAIDPTHAVAITVYHVNPHAAGAIPANMDTGDAAGDLFFDLEEVIIHPLACPPGARAYECTNPEAAGADLVVTRLTLEVDARYSSRYAKCNMGVNGTDQRGHPCRDGTYCCFCSDAARRPAPCEAAVGRENIRDRFGRGGHHSACLRDGRPSDCYRAKVAQKLTAATPGYWYSTLATSLCGAPGATACAWRVVGVDKIVTRRCHTATFGAVVAAATPACFAGCGAQSTNTSSPCWTDCFYRAVLGPDAGRPGGAVGGMPLPALLEAWERPFLPEALGGCPPLAAAAPWFLRPPPPPPALSKAGDALHGEPMWRDGSGTGVEALGTEGGGG